MMNLVDTNATAGCGRCWLTPEYYSKDLNRQVWPSPRACLPTDHADRQGEFGFEIKTERDIQHWMEMEGKEDYVQEQSGLKGKCEYSRLEYWTREICFQVEPAHVFFGSLKRAFKMMHGSRRPNVVSYTQPTQEVMQDRLKKYNEKKQKLEAKYKTRISKVVREHDDISRINM